MVFLRFWPSSWGLLGPSREPLGASWSHLGSILGSSWSILEHLGASRAHLGSILGPLGAILGANLLRARDLGLILGPLGAILGANLLRARGDNHRRYGKTTDGRPKKKSRCSRRGPPKRLTCAGLLEEKIRKPLTNSEDALARGLANSYVYMYVSAGPPSSLAQTCFLLVRPSALELFCLC